jgi:hypothetical protein
LENFTCEVQTSRAGAGILTRPFRC